MLDIQKIRNTFTNENIRVVFLFVCLILSIASFSKNKNHPPNGIKINDTLFIDETEVTNRDWSEYVFWMSKIYGDSFAVKNCVPNEELWFTNRPLRYGEPYLRHYFKHPAYSTYPVVAITYKQVSDYIQWREDRIYENSLVKHKILTFQITTDSTQIFTIESFLNGSFKCNPENVEKLKAIPIYKFRLPTLEEYKSIEQDAYIGYLKSMKKDSILSDITTDVHWSYPNKLGIFNLTQNVSEMTNIEGIAYGGNWTMKEIPRDYTTTYTEPTIWLGFRCIATVTNFTDYQSVYN